MRKFSLIRLKNEMLIGNFISNVIGVQVVDIITRQTVSPVPKETLALAARLDLIFTPISFCLVGSLIILYELPIRRYLNNCFRHRTPSKEQTLSARQRLLNEPFVLVALNMMIWLIAAIFYITVFYLAQTGGVNLRRIFFQTVLVGLVTCIIAFFVSERILQKRLVPHFFPEGGLFTTPKTLRISIRIRLAAIVFACNIIPCIAFIGTLKGVYSEEANPEMMLETLNATILTSAVIFMGVGLYLAFLVSSNLTRPFGEIIQVLKGIKRGRLDKKVRVTSNDEIGYTGDVINEMAAGLKEREKMRRSLDLAREVQQNLLPKLPPASKYLDIAGKSLYCDQTGGDYFDFLNFNDIQGSKVGLVVGDVSGHGMPSALLMASVRAFLRLRSCMPGSISQVVTDVNRQLTRDVEDTGRFMTLFYLMFHPQARSLSWVRAGHDPGMFYNPETDTFRELAGRGIALGLDENWPYEQNELPGLTRGQIVVLGTDGIWEACNAAGEMFGKQRVRELIRGHRSETSAKILQSVTDALTQFQVGVDASDDVTLIVVKIKDE